MFTEVSRKTCSTELAAELQSPRLSSGNSACPVDKEEEREEEKTRYTAAGDPPFRT